MKIVERLRFRKRFVLGLIRPSRFRSAPTWISETPVLDLISSSDTEVLESSFRAFGSDKSTVHDYHIPYSWILDQLPSGAIALEIGIGTNNPELPSTMGVTGVPGASLRAWKSSGVFKRIIGADVDPSCLFQEGIIQTYLVNQLHVESLDELARETLINQTGVDLIVDDGLHTFEANLNTLNALYPFLNEAGFYVIEDVIPSDLTRMISFLYRSFQAQDISIWTNAEKGPDNTLLILRKSNANL